jgi:hypothetical protein
VWDAVSDWAFWRKEVFYPCQNSIPIFRWGGETGKSAVSLVYSLHNQPIVVASVGARYLFCSQHPGQFWGPTQSPIHWVPVVLPGVKWLWCQIDQSPPSRTEVTNEWSYTSTTPILCRGKTSPLPRLYIPDRSNRMDSPLILPT